MTIDEIYLKIGQEVFNVIEDENWGKARLNIEVVGDGVVGYTGDTKLKIKSKIFPLEKLTGKSNFGFGSFMKSPPKVETTNGTELFLRLRPTGILIWSLSGMRNWITK